MKILERRCFLLSHSEVILMVIFGLISVSQVSAETQGAAPAPQTAKSSTNDGKGVERWSAHGQLRSDWSHSQASHHNLPAEFGQPPAGFGQPPAGFYEAHNNAAKAIEWWAILLIVILVLGVLGCCVGIGVCICCSNRGNQGQPGMVHNTQPPQGGIAAAPPGYPYNSGTQYYGQGQMPVTYYYSPQNNMPYGQGQMPMTYSPQNDNNMPYGHISSNGTMI